MALVLSLAFMPPPRALPVVAPPSHHHHAHRDQIAAAAETGRRPASKAPKGCEERGGCPFCSAHPGFSPPPPQMAALPPPSEFEPAAGPVALEAAPAAPRFQTSLWPRAPPVIAA